LGVDTGFYKPTGEQKENFVVGLGTIYHAKGVDRAIRAVGAIAEDIRPDLVWVGNGAFETELQEYQLLSQDLGVNFITKIHIADNEVISLLSRAAAMIYTSRLEPFGYAPLEANACGTAVVGIAEGGVKETVCHGTNGYLAPDNDPVKIGEYLTRLVSSREYATEMGAKAREHVVNYWGLEKGTDNIESVLLSMAARNSDRKNR
jgi:glycosyltransferase involved in cell wall biosynthesis